MVWSYELPGSKPSSRASTESREKQNEALSVAGVTQVCVPGPFVIAGKDVMRRRAAPIGISVIRSVGSVELVGLQARAPLHGVQPSHFGLFAVFASLDMQASSALTQKRYGWRPDHPGLIDDLDEGHYFTGW